MTGRGAANAWQVDVVDRLAAELAEHLEVVRGAAELLPALSEVGACITGAYQQGGTVLTFGNGGSAADAQHLAAELVGRFRRERRPLAAAALTVDPSVTSCIGNDYAFDEVFARQVRALARPGDVVIGFTTSGRSGNVVKWAVQPEQARDDGARSQSSPKVISVSGDL